MFKVVDEDGGEAACHPDADVEHEERQEAQELSGQGTLSFHPSGLHFTALSRYCGPSLGCPSSAKGGFP